jgi:hypothetical protein
MKPDLAAEYGAKEAARFESASPVPLALRQRELLVQMFALAYQSGYVDGIKDAQRLVAVVGKVPEPV